MRFEADRSYVTALEEKIRQLESRMDSGEFRGQNGTAEENDTLDSSGQTGFPLSPTSVKDVLELVHRNLQYSP